MIHKSVSNYILQGTIEMPLFGYIYELVIDVNVLFMHSYSFNTFIKYSLIHILIKILLCVCCCVDSGGIMVRMDSASAPTEFTIYGMTASHMVEMVRCTVYGGARARGKVGNENR